ncbi:hypothetical protein ACEN2T_17380 [Pseudomonas sp. W22_MBD1_FP4]|uniref:hypothetical protein n=1 Tax=Pseudomonas sp. W22_MBD1_FP4 TaxID=3240272 RepID=UPI003F9AA642
MANDLTILSTTAQNEARPEKFDANLEPLKAGQYWKTSCVIPAKVKVTQELVYKWDKSEEDTYQERRQVLRKEVGAGVVLLVKNLKHDDVGLHNVIVAAHPLWTDQSDLAFFAAEFHDYFERCFDAEAVRLQERLALESDLGRLQQEIIAGPPPSDIPPLLAAPTNQGSPSVGAMVQHVRSLGDLKTQSMSVIETAKRHTAFIQEKTGEISKKTGLLVRFYSEQASASLASVSDVVAYAEHLKKGVASMGLYTGEGVEINTWVTGAPAPADEPIWLFQDLIFLEEEFLVQLDDAGLDAASMGSFVAALKSDTSLRDRILPYPRTVVLARIRREGVIYNSESSIGAAYENMIANQPNLTSFLLIRNGENIHQIWSELATDSAKRLFPSGEDVDKIFAGIDGSDITVEDLNYTDKLDDHDAYALFYKRLLILLWGLNDNHQIFGDFYDVASYRGFFDLGFQNKHFRFVREDDVKLGTQRPTYDVWFRQMNAYLQSGSRVLVYLPGNWNQDQVSGAFTAYGEFRSEAYERLTWKGPDAQLLIAKRQGERYYVEVQSRYTGHRDVREPVLKLFLGRSGHKRHANDHLVFSHLVMDAVKPGDIAFYRESRTNRKYYSKYMATLFAIGDLAQEQFDLEAPFTAALIDAARQGRLKIPSDVSLPDEAGHAVRLWRASHRGEAPPAPSDVAYAGALKSTLATLYQLLRAGHNPMDDMPAFIAENMITPLRFVMTGKGKYGLYVETPAAERDDRIHKHVWVTRITVECTKSGLVELSRKLVRYPKATAEETTLHEWPENQSNWASVSIADELTSDRITKLIAEADAHLSRLDYFSGKFDWEELYEDLVRYVRSHKTGYVELPTMVAQVGIHCREDAPSTQEAKNGTRKFNRLVVRQGVCALLFKFGNESQRTRLINFLESRYENPESAIAWVKTLGNDQPSLMVYYNYDPSVIFEKARMEDRGIGIARNWQDVLRQQDRTCKQDYIDRQYVSRPLRTFEEAVPYIPAAALQWINDHATAPDVVIK